MSSTVVAVTGIVGVIAGALLRPILDELFERRKLSLYLEVEPNNVSLMPPGNSGLTLQIDKKNVDRFFARDFVIINRTGRTQRNFVLTIDFVYETGVSERHQLIELNRSDDADVKFKSKEAGTFAFDILRFDRNGKISGRVISTYLGKIKSYSDSDLEVFVRPANSVFRPLNFLTSFGPIALAVGYLIYGYFWS